MAFDARERRPDDGRAVLPEPLGHPEQVVGGLVEVGQDERLDTLAVRDLVEEPALGVGAAPLLAALQHEDADPAGEGGLRFELLVEVALGLVQRERLDPPALGADDKAARRIEDEVVSEAEPKLALTRGHYRLIDSGRPRESA